MIKWLKHPDYVNFLMEYIPGHEETEIRESFSKKFGIILSEGQIGNFKHRHKIKSGTKGGCFKKGMIPHNKGKRKRMPPEVYQKCAPTMFKKGNIPPNHREVGSERINRDGYIEVKIAEPRTWRPKQRIIWEKHFGEKLKRNEVVIFLDGDKRNFDINNLYKLDRASLARFNQDHLYCGNRDISRAAAIIADIKGKVGELKNERST